MGAPANRVPLAILVLHPLDTYTPEQLNRARLIWACLNPAASSSSSPAQTTPEPVTTNDIVVYLARPEWGPGLIEAITPNGWLEISFEIDGQYWRSEFSPHEVDLLDRAKATA